LVLGLVNLPCDVSVLKSKKGVKGGLPLKKKKNKRKKKKKKEKRGVQGVSP